MLQPKDTDWLNGYKNKTRVYAVDRKSTRLNSSHTVISYAVFCLKKKKKKKAGVAILISDKMDFKIKTVVRDKEGHYLMIKGSIPEEDISIVNIYALNIGAPQYIR